MEATDRRWARVKIFETVIYRLEDALEKRGVPLPVESHVEEPDDELEAELEAQDEEE